MLLDAGEQSTWAFVRESGSLVFGGLRERRTISARAGTRRLLADSSCQAVLICLALWLISALKPEVTAGPNHQLLVQEVVLPAILAAALIGYERIAAVSGLAAIAAFTPLGLHTQPVWLPKLLVPIARLLVMLCSPRKRPRDARRLLWLVPVCVACGAPRPRRRQPAGSSRGRVRLRAAPTLPRPTVSDGVQLGLARLDCRADTSCERNRPARPRLARYPRRHGWRTHADRCRTTVDASGREERRGDLDQD